MGVVLSRGLLLAVALGLSGSTFVAEQRARAEDPPPEEPAPPEKEPDKKPERGAPKTVEKDGVTVTASLKVVEHGFAKFDVVAKNSNDAKRTIKGKIRLKTADGKKAGRCTIYAEVPASGETLVVCNAKETVKEWTVFELEISKVFKF